jgi:CRISPR-associated protein (TIGR03984 family)
MKIHQIREIQHQVQPVTVENTFEDDAAAWLVDRANEHALTTMLACADDGVIWGKVEQGELLTSRDAFPQAQVSPALRPLTLQQLWLFGRKAELLLWRASDRWQARLIVEGAGTKSEFFDEWQILWGTRCEMVQSGFTLVADGALEHRHAPPIEIAADLFSPDEDHRPLRLQVRHYLETTPDTSLLRVHLSRLVRVTDETQVGKEQVQ